MCYSACLFAATNRGYRFGDVRSCHRFGAAYRLQPHAVQLHLHDTTVVPTYILALNERLLYVTPGTFNSYGYSGESVLRANSPTPFALMCIAFSLSEQCRTICVLRMALVA